MQFLKIESKRKQMRHTDGFATQGGTLAGHLKYSNECIPVSL